VFLRELNFSVDRLKGAGPETVRHLAAAGITSIAGLLSYYPRDWQNRSRDVPLREYARGSAVMTTVRVLAHAWFYPRGVRTLKIYVEDESARASLVCFNRPFLESKLLIGRRYRLWGPFKYYGGEITSASFEYEDADTPPKISRFCRILPVYPLTGSLTQGLLMRLEEAALEQFGKNIEDELPDSVTIPEGLFSKAAAIRAIHFPETIDDKDKARKTLIWEELFYLELLVGRRAMERKKGYAGGGISPKLLPAGGADSADKDGFTVLQAQLLARLPFSLTGGQAQAVREINCDMDGPFPMTRLLQGDVGSGKTLVSFLAALKAVQGGGQAAIMAPTELLARQHSENAARLLEPLGLRIANLTGNIKAKGRAALLKNLASGTIDIVLGTHALFSRDVMYKKLRLVVIDEQHRFGVTQRQAIMAKGPAGETGRAVPPDLLMMSATPIPRTLALTVFGDMDVSVISGLPPGRKPVTTHLAMESNEKKVYDFVRKELEKGRQAYFVYPLIENGVESSLKDAQTMAKRLADEIFRGFPVALIHSKLDEDQKRSTMSAFREGRISVLASTTVVEVGVDVPNAACMVVEHAERFGLSALHQLRGRVGRGAEQSYCFLVYSDNLTEDGKARLKVMLSSNDGFFIAEEDLKLRGPGQIAGREQSGYFTLGIAEPIRDADLLLKAREAAFAILEKDEDFALPEHRMIAEVLRRAPPFPEIGF
jgi:ATP-dependent DNA helicase RecG